MFKANSIQTSSPLNLQPSAFTLAEVMIVLGIIGILVAVLLPVARNSTPSENVVKFKKAHNALHSTIQELVTSDKYYLDGDLGVKTDGNLVDNPIYLCKTISNILNIKENNCNESNTTFVEYNLDAQFDIRYREIKDLDSSCKNSLTKTEQIILENKVILYESVPGYHFNVYWPYDGRKTNLFRGDHTTSDGFNAIYKIFCIDIDGIDYGEDPFGYAIRIDGKIINGERAQIWLEKDIQDKN